MGYYAMVVPAYVGHLNPMTVLGRALQRRGHRVAFVSPLDAGAKVRKAGLEFIPIASLEFPAGEWERTTAEMGALSGRAASWFAGRWVGRFARGIVRELPVIAEREFFDGMVMDQVSLGTECVCSAMGLPMAVASAALNFHVEPGIPPCVNSWRYSTSLWSYLRNLIGYALMNSTGMPLMWATMAYRRKHRLPQMRPNHINTLPPSLVQVAQQPEFFDFPRRHLPDHFHYTGPWIERSGGETGDFPWDRLDKRPLIYASMGTLQNRLERVFQVIATACAGLDVQLVIGLGRRGAAVPSDLAGNPIVAGYAPQRALLKRAALVITHGGLNTTLECLGEGLPLVALPVTNDQPGVAARIQHLGVGEFIPIKKLTAPNLKEALRRVLETPAYRERAALCAAEIRDVDGPAMAAGLIETAFTTKQRVRRIPQGANR